MKSILVVIITGGLIGMLFDETIRRVFDRNYKPDFKEFLKQKLNFFVYGTGFFLIYLIYKIPCLQKINFLLIQMILGMIVCTLTELGYGLLFNVKLKLNLWDYSFVKIKLFGKEIKLNYKGQISVLHSLIWGLLTPLVFIILNFIV